MQDFLRRWFDHSTSVFLIIFILLLAYFWNRFFQVRQTMHVSISSTWNYASEKAYCYSDFPSSFSSSTHHVSQINKKLKIILHLTMNYQTSTDRYNDCPMSIAPNYSSLLSLFLIPMIYDPLFLINYDLIQYGWTLSSNKQLWFGAECMNCFR